MILDNAQLFFVYTKWNLANDQIKYTPTKHEEL